MRAPSDLHAVAVENLTVGRVDPLRFVEAAAAAGFGAVGLPLASATPVPLEHEIVGRPEVVRAIKAALQRTGTRVFDVEAFVLSPTARLEDFRRILDTGAELGATHISVIGAQIPGNSEFLEQQQRVELFAGLCEEAASRGLRVGVECMKYRDVRSVAEALALLEAAGHPHAGIILDPLHLHRAGTTAVQLAGLPPERISWAQLCDASPADPALDDLPAEARGGRLHPGHGILPLRTLLVGLPEGTPLAVETPVAAELDWTIEDRLRSAADHALRWFRASAE
jgi:sugar phosphate isomerase/epimerase